MTRLFSPRSGLIAALFGCLLAAAPISAQVVLDDYSVDNFGANYTRKDGTSSAWDVSGGLLAAQSGGGYSAFIWTATGAVLENVGDSFSIQLSVPSGGGDRNAGLAIWKSSAFDTGAGDRVFEPRLNYSGFSGAYDFTAEENNVDGFVSTNLGSGHSGFSTLTVTFTDFTAGTTTLTAELSGGGLATVTQDFSFTFTGSMYVGPSSYQGVGNVFFDNLTYTAVSAVPEPSTYAVMVGACALALATWRRRRFGVR